MGYKAFEFVVSSPNINRIHDKEYVEKQINDFIKNVCIDKVFVNIYDVIISKEDPRSIETRKSIDIFYD